MSFRQSVELLVFVSAINPALDPVCWLPRIEFLVNRLPLALQSGMTLVQAFQFDALRLRRPGCNHPQFGLLQPGALLLQQMDEAINPQGFQLCTRNGLTRKNRRHADKLLAFQPLMCDFAVHRRDTRFQRGQRCPLQPDGAGIDFLCQFLQ